MRKELKTIGRVINYTEDGVLWVKTNNDTPYYPGQTVKITLQNSDAWIELQGLYRILLEFVKIRRFELPPVDIEALRTLPIDVMLKLRVGAIEYRYKETPEGIPERRAAVRSTSTMDFGEFSVFYELVRNYVAKYIDLTEFEKQHTKARQNLGKE